jgi:hypothetical protein
MLTVSEQLIGGTVQKRQTVMSGPNVSGVPNFLPSTSVSLSLTSQNITSTDPLIITSANGFFLDGAQKNSTGSSISNLTWSGLTASNTNYLYVTIAGGTLTPLETILPPIYQFGGTPSITSGQFTFNISEMRGYLGNGSTAPQSNVVFVGEAVCGGSTVTSTIAYAYNGFYDSGLVPVPATSSRTAFNMNIGGNHKYISIEPFLRFNTSVSGFIAGDIVVAQTVISQTNDYTIYSPIYATSGNVVYYVTNSSGPAMVGNPATGATSLYLITVGTSIAELFIKAKRNW